MSLTRAVTRGLAARLFAPGSPQSLALLRAAWPRAVGPDVARRTEPLLIEKGTLRVRVPDARWRKVLHRMQGEILARLRELAGEAAPRRLGFSEGPVAEAPEASPESASARPAAPPASIVAAAGAIPDPELRARFLESAARYLGAARRGPA